MPYRKKTYDHIECMYDRIANETLMVVLAGLQEEEKSKL